MIGNHLKIFTDKKFVPNGAKPCLMLIPFFGHNHTHDGYSRFEREGKEFLQLAAPEHADVAVLPFDGSCVLDQRKTPNPKAIELATAFVAQARAAGLKTIVIVNSDSTEPIQLPDVIVFRTSLNRRTRANNEFALPAWHEDLARNHFGGQIHYRKRPDVPSVGFCGHVATSRPRLRRRIKMAIRKLGQPLGIRIEHKDGIYMRRAAMDALSRCPMIRTDFIRRSQYFGGVEDDPVFVQQIRRDYVQNLFHNDYTLCLRGYGNFSFRFFEAMSLGRIPLLIDTDCVLPYDFLHDYNKYGVIVPESKLHDVGRLLKNFHHRISDDGYVQIQREIREFWMRWLSPEGFFRRLPLHLRPELADRWPDFGEITRSIPVRQQRRKVDTFNLPRDPVTESTPFR